VHDFPELVEFGTERAGGIWRAFVDAPSSPDVHDRHSTGNINITDNDGSSVTAMSVAHTPANTVVITLDGTWADGNTIDITISGVSGYNITGTVAGVVLHYN